MKNKIIFLVISLSFLAILFGCNGGGNSPIIAKNIADKQEITNRYGLFPKPIKFDSGATIDTIEEGTFAENVVVKVTETKTSEIGLNPIGNPSYIYIYTITAKLVDENTDEISEVNSLEKPLKITLPSEHLGKEGILYVGIREDEKSPWIYSRVSNNDVINSSRCSLRAAKSEITLPEYIFKLFRPNIQFALFLYNKPTEEALNDISVFSMIATNTTTLLNFNNEGNYLNDVDVSIKLDGDNLSRLSAQAITISIIYRTEKSSPVDIKVNNAKCKHTTEEKSDSAVLGKNYYVHTLILNASNFDATFDGEAKINFTLNLNGISKSDFPKEFLLEVSSFTNVDENLIPFSYSNSMNFVTNGIYSIFYTNIEGANFESENPEKYGEASDTFTLKNPTKDGFAFAGWTGTGLDSLSMKLTIPQGSKGNRIYTANWSNDFFTVVLNKNTGINSVIGAGNYSFGTEVTVGYILKDGYEFVSWTGDMRQNVFAMPANNVEMTANAKPILYSISYELNGGVIAGSNPKSYDVTSSTININNPTKEGYTFAGWTGTNQDTPTTSLSIPQGSTGNREYTANWSIKPHTVTLTPDTGIASVIGEGSYNYGQVVNVSYTLEDGYEFDSWSGDMAQSSFTMPDKDISMVAHAKPILYSISYELNGGVIAGSNPKSYDVTSSTINIKNPTKEGYTFAGWTGTNQDTPTTSLSIPQGSTGNREYTAHWTINQHTVTLHTSTGIATVAGGGDFNYGQIVNLSYTLEDGYDFVSWTIGDNPTEAIFTMPDSNLEITANANLHTYNLVLNLDSGEPTGDNPTTFRMDSGDIAISNPTRENYTFVGWTGEGLSVASMSLTIPHGSIGDRTYTATWAETYKTITIPGSTAEIELRCCPPGTFQMGSPTNEPQRQNNEVLHEVTLTKHFYIGVTEVTQAQYKAVMTIDTPYHNDSFDFPNVNKPADKITWYAANYFCTKLQSMIQVDGYQFDLPTEAQWEYACRAGTTSAYSFGDAPEAIDGYAWTSGRWNAIYSTGQVRQKSPNLWGLYDMHGNVQEWCKDCLGDYPNTAVTDPICITGTYYILRGGGWWEDRGDCRSACRGATNVPPTDYKNDNGFRIVLIPTM